LEGFIRETISNRVSLIATDDHGGYRKLGEKYPHGFVRHCGGEYLVGAVHTNTIEGFWSIFKRGVVGTFHKISKKYMPLYVAEFPVPAIITARRRYFWCGDSRVLKRGHWRPSQLETNDASDPKEEQLELPFRR